MATTTSITKYGVPVSLSVEKGTKSKYKRRVGFAYPVVRASKIVATNTLQNSNAGPPICFGKATGVDLIKNNLEQLIRTEKGERVMLPDYGLALKKYLFSPLDETTYALLKEDILKNIRKYFSIGRVLKLVVFGSNKEAEKNQLRITLTLQLLDESLDVFDIEAKVG